MHHETHALWISRILFNFEDISTLLNKLTVLPPSTLSQIKNLRIGGRALFLAPGTFVHRREYYSHVWALKFLPELSLDRLTVLGVKDGRENYNVLDDLIKFGHGWRELYFISQDSSIFGFARLDMNASTGVPLQRKPQPSYWNEVLQRQDGADSQCSVTIYRSVESDAPGSVMDPKRRRVFEQEVILIEEDPTQVSSFGRDEDEQLMADGEVGKEILVVVRRGINADISGLVKQLGGIQGLMEKTQALGVAPTNRIPCARRRRSSFWTDCTRTGGSAARSSAAMPPKRSAARAAKRAARANGPISAGSSTDVREAR